MDDNDMNMNKSCTDRENSHTDKLNTDKTGTDKSKTNKENTDKSHTLNMGNKDTDRDRTILPSTRTPLTDKAKVNPYSHIHKLIFFAISLICLIMHLLEKFMNIDNYIIQ
jgi:hypothetical protein